MYLSTFNIEFPNIAELSKSVSTRHDLVHRNGKTKNGDQVIVDKEIIDKLILAVINFVEQISVTLKLKG